MSRIVAGVAALVLGCLQASPAATGPCDIYKAAGDPCGAAYSTVRALFGAYGGNLYQVRNASGATKEIGVVSAGYVANSATQDNFCSGTTCTISIIYDQTGNGNHLTKAPGGSKDYGPQPDIEAVATALPIYLDGHKVYGVHITPNSSWTGSIQTGYRFVGAGKGIATGDNPETIYEVTDGTYTNGQCCFDFGNAEKTAVAGGYGTMEALYFGSNNWWDKGAGNGPWIMADLEVGVYNWGGANAYSDANKNGSKINNNDISFNYPFVTAMLKGNSKSGTGGGPFTLKGGNAQSGTLTTVWDGAFPVGYSPMNRQGGIVLGVGGDNSGQSQGNFFEGVMTTGFASAATDAAIQANIVAAGYGSKTSVVELKEAATESKTILGFDKSSGRASLRFNLAEDGKVNVDILDLRGRLIATIERGMLSAGRREVVWDANLLPPGIHVARLVVDRRTIWSGRFVSERL